MFDLNDITRESVLFAMEDQSRSTFIEEWSGKAVRPAGLEGQALQPGATVYAGPDESGGARSGMKFPQASASGRSLSGETGAGGSGRSGVGCDEEGRIESEGEYGPEYGMPRTSDEDSGIQALLVPPFWSSEDGFALMEDYLGRIRNPEARIRLSAALGRGKGVFRAFKEVLTSYPGLDDGFRELKRSVMSARILSWYGDLREVRGLARLPEAPEDSDDLLRSELPVVIRSVLEIGQKIQTLIDACRDSEDLDLAQISMPRIGILQELSLARFLRELEARTEGLASVSEDDAGGLLACAVGFFRQIHGSVVGSVEFLCVFPPFRRMGLGGAAVDSLVQAFKERGVVDVVVDLPMVPAEFSVSMRARGYREFGMRAVVPES